MDVFTLFGKIAIDNSNANKGIDETIGKANGLATAMGNAFAKAGSFAISCGKTIAKGLAVGGAAMATLITGSVKQYAEYEQLVGGVDTLFKDSSSKVQEYAANAYKNQGMSANDYMSTVTSFSASLLQSLSGDTSAAADVANMALTDMADNANKMGTSMSSIQDAYQGFAKQNYTMLDNLKLGYGGTKTEMQRLLKDAQKISGVKYNIKNLDDVYEAIHVIQTEMGITGTTALEASETISGSFFATGAAWTNMLIGIASGSKDLDKLINNFAGSAVTAIGNITKLLPSITNGVTQMINGLAPMLPGVIQDLLPSVVQGAVALISGLASALPGLLESLFAMLPFIVDSLVQSIEQIWPALVDAISAGWSNVVWPAIQEFFKVQFGIELPDWSVISETISQNMAPIVANVESAFGNMVSFFTDMSTALGAISTWISANQGVVLAFFGALAIAMLAINAPLTLIGGALVLLAANWDAIKATAIAVWDAIVLAWESAGTWFDESVIQPITQFFSGLWTGISTWASDTWTNIQTAWNTACIWFNDNIVIPISGFFSGLWTGISTWASDAWTNIQTAWNTAATWFDTNIVQPISTAIGGVVSIIEGIGTAWTNLKNTLSPISTSVTISEFRKQGHTEQETTAALLAGEVVPDADPVTVNAKGAIFSKATIFDTRLGKQMVGEAGEEAVAPISVLRQYVREEVMAVNNENAKQMQGMREDFRQFMGELPEVLANSLATMRFDVNNREFARLVKAVN